MVAIRRRPYGWRGLAGDAAGGTIAALIALPYGLAMAQLMGLPPELGLFTAAAVLATNAVAAVATAGCFMPPETFWKNLPQCRGSWPGFESEPSSLERRISDHLLTGKTRTSRFAWRMANLQEINSTRPTVPAVPRDSSRSCRGWPGWWGFLPEQDSPGNRTGSRAGRSLPCSPLHPETKNRSR